LLTAGFSRAAFLATVFFEAALRRATVFGAFRADADALRLAAARPVRRPAAPGFVAERRAAVGAVRLRGAGLLLRVGFRLAMKGILSDASACSNPRFSGAAVTLTVSGK
jgi:hypothetical protein